MARNLEFDEQEVINKAMDVFWKKGFNGTTMRDLTAAMDINASSLYRSFGDKHALFVKCIKHYAEARVEEAKRFAINQRSPVEALVSFINLTATVITGGRDSCMALKTTFEIADNDPDIQKIVKADHDFTHYFIKCLLNRAMTQGAIKPVSDIETMTDHITGAFTGWHESYILHKDAGRVHNMAQLLINQLTG